jgi:GAF domain-containing protein
VDEMERLRSRVAELEHVELERQRAHAALLVRVQQQAAVAKLGVRALAVSDTNVLFSEAVCVLRKTLDIDYAKVLELLPEREELLLRAGVGWRAGLVGQGTVSAGIDSQAGYTLASAAPVIVEDLRTESRFSGPPLLREHGVVSGMSVIIHGEDHPFGVLGAHTREQRTFTDHDVHFLQAIANVLAATVGRERTEAERRRLEDREELARVQAERAAAQLRELRAVSDLHLADSAVDDLLQQLLGRLMQLLEADTASILLPDDDGYLVSRAAAGLEANSEQHVRIPPARVLPAAWPPRTGRWSSAT